MEIKQRLVIKQMYGKAGNRRAALWLLDYFSTKYIEYTIYVLVISMYQIDT